MPYSLWKLFGIARSGNHAIINWLIGLDQENTFFFNNRKPGVDLFKNPSGVSLPDGHKAYASRISGKKTIHEDLVKYFKNSNQNWNLLVSFENYDVGKFNEDLLNFPITQEFGTYDCNINLLIIRNPFNTISSLEIMKRNAIRKNKIKKNYIINKIRFTENEIIEQILNKRMEIWKSYAFLCLNPNSPTRGKFMPIIFDRWIEDRKYRDSIAELLGYNNMDKFIDFVSDAGKGSSFEGVNMKNSNNTLSRWDQGRKELCKKVLRNHPEVIDYASLLFGNHAIPADIQACFE